MRLLLRRAAVVRPDGWHDVRSPLLTHIEINGTQSATYLAVWDRVDMNDILAALGRSSTRRPFQPRTGNQLPILFSQGTAGVLFHELVGHLLEGDIVAAGTSPLCPIGRRGSWPSSLHVVDDPTRFDLPGAFTCDDEGVPARPLTLIQHGEVAGALCDRESAAALARAPAGGRRSTWSSPPVPRLSNLIIAPGAATVDNLRNDIRSGLEVCSLTGATVDPVSGRAVIRVESGWEIRHGRRRRPACPLRADRDRSPDPEGPGARSWQRPHPRRATGLVRQGRAAPADGIRRTVTSDSPDGGPVIGPNDRIDPVERLHRTAAATRDLVVHTAAARWEVFAKASTVRELVFELDPPVRHAHVQETGVAVRTSDTDRRASAPPPASSSMPPESPSRQPRHRAPASASTLCRQPGSSAKPTLRRQAVLPSPGWAAHIAEQLIDGVVRATDRRHVIRRLRFFEATYAWLLATGDGFVATHRDAMVSFLVELARRDGDGAVQQEWLWVRDPQSFDPKSAATAMCNRALLTTSAVKTRDGLADVLLHPEVSAHLLAAVAPVFLPNPAGVDPLTSILDRDGRLGSRS